MIYNLAEYLRQPLKIGNKSIEKRLLLAPLSILGNIAFRELLSLYGGYGLLFSEMCSAKTVPMRIVWCLPVSDGGKKNDRCWSVRFSVTTHLQWRKPPAGSKVKGYSVWT